MKKFFKNCGEDEQVDVNKLFAQSPLKDQLYGAFLQDKKIIINEEINDSLIEKAVMQIYNFNEIDNGYQIQDDRYTRDPIMVYINSVGGALNEAFSFISAVKTSKTPVFTVALGKAMSAGFLMLLAGHRRYCQPYSVLMHHQGSAGVIGEFKSIQEYSTHCDIYQEIIDNYVMQQTKIKRKKLNEVFHHKQDWYIHSQEALDLGIVHDIYTS